MLASRTWVALLAAGALCPLAASSAPGATVISNPPTFTPIAGPTGNYVHLINEGNPSDSEQWEVGIKAKLGEGTYVFEIDLCVVDAVSSGAARLHNKYDGSSRWYQPPELGSWYRTAITFTITDRAEPEDGDLRLVGIDWPNQRSEILFDNIVLRDALGTILAGPLTFDGDIVGEAPTQMNNANTNVLEQFVVVPEPMGVTAIGAAGLLLMRRRRQMA